MEVDGEDAADADLRGFQELVVTTYPNLSMLRGITYTEDDIGKYLQLGQGSLFGATPPLLSEAEQEMLAFIQANNRNGIRTTLKGLRREIRAQALRLVPGGDPVHRWPSCAGGVRSKSAPDANLLEDDALERALTQHPGLPNVILEPQIDSPPAQVRRLKDFYSDSSTAAQRHEARALGKETGGSFTSLVDEI